MGISENAVQYIKELSKNKELFEKISSDWEFMPFETPLTFFMAGSPGAGKTEVSKRFIENLNKKGDFPIVRIDADEVREICPGYTGENAHLFQEAAALGVNKLYDHVLKKKYNALVDGTFSSLKYAQNNIERALARKRKVVIFYVYQNPFIAWEFTIKRERLEQRKITPEVFVEDFFAARNNVMTIKKKFKTKVTLGLIKKDYQHNIQDYLPDIGSIDDFVEFEYDKDTLYQQIVRRKFQ